MSWASEVLADSPARAFHLDAAPSGVLDDYSPAGVDGTVLGTTTVVAAFLNNGVQTDGLGGYINIPIPTFTTAWSLEYLYKWTSSTGVWRNQTSSGGWLLLHDATNATLRANGTDRTLAGLGAILRDGNFHFILHSSTGTAITTEVRSTTGALEFSDVWTITAAASTVNNGGPIRFGRNGSLNAFHGLVLDECNVYDYALSTARFQAHIAQVVPPGVPTSVAVTAATTDSLTLDWSAPATGGAVTSYQVRIDGGAPVTATAPHVFTGLTAGTSYTLEVRAVGPAGSSSYVAVVDSTGTVITPPGYYRVQLEVGFLTYTADSEDAPEYGVRLPLSLGWSMPDTTEFFPCQPDQTTMVFQLYVATPEDLGTAPPVKGSAVTFNMFVDADPAAEPWQTFTGVVTQMDGEYVQPNGGFLVTVYATDDTARLAGYVVGYTFDWPQESIGDRIDRIASEAGINVDTTFTSPAAMGGTLAARPKAPTDALTAIRQALKDSAGEDNSTTGFPYYGRVALAYLRDDESVAWDATNAGPYTTPPWDTTLFLYDVYRRVPGEWQDPPDTDQLELEGCLVEATGKWAKLPGPDGRKWAVVDGTTFGTPDGPPIPRNTSLVDIIPGDNSGTSGTRDALGESLLPDGSTQLEGWYARTLRYDAAADPAPVGPYVGAGPGLASWAPLTVVIPVTVVDVDPRYDLENVGYLAGTLTGARMVIPPGGRFYLDLRLRPELLAGMTLP